MTSSEVISSKPSSGCLRRACVVGLEALRRTMLRVPKGPLRAGFVGPKMADHWDIQSSGQMHGPSVAADEQSRAPTSAKRFN